MSNPFEAEVLSHNLALIVGVLRKHNLASLTIEYAGSGDSGDTFELAVFDADDNAQPLPTDSLAGKHVRRTYGAAPVYTVHHAVEDDTTSRPFSDFLEDFHCIVLEKENRQGYENNDGGGGQLTIRVSGEFTLDHYDWVTHKDEFTSDLSEFMPPVPEPTPEPERQAVALPAVVRAEPYCVEV